MCFKTIVLKPPVKYRTATFTSRHAFTAPTVMRAATYMIGFSCRERFAATEYTFLGAFPPHLCVLNPTNQKVIVLGGEKQIIIRCGVPDCHRSFGPCICQPRDDGEVTRQGSELTPAMAAALGKKNQHTALQFMA